MAIGTDRVQVVATERTDQGGDPNDLGPYGDPRPIDPQEDALESAGGYVQDETVRDFLVGWFRDLGELFLFDTQNAPVSLATLATTSGGGITEPQHEALDTLKHRIAESNHIEIVRSGGKVSRMTQWTDSGKTTKIREIEITRASGKASVIAEKQYDGSGTLDETLTSTLNRTSGQVTSVDEVLS